MFFFSESAICFLDLQILKKNIPKNYLGIWNLKFKIPAQNSIMLWAGILNFKFRIVFWNILLGDLKKQIALSEKKPPLMITVH